MAKHVSEMVRGLGTATRFIRVLTEAIERHGGNEEMIRSLTTDFGQNNVDQVAKLICTFKWFKPLALTFVRDEAARCSRKNHSSSEWVAHDQQFFWTPALHKHGMPVVAFEDESDFIWPIPDEISKQLDGKPVQSGMPISWEGREYLVVGIDMFTGIQPNQLVVLSKIEMLHLALTEYFDLGD